MDKISPRKWTAGELKQELIKDYNNINLRMFDIGVQRQRVDIISDKIFFLAVHKRIPSLKYLDKNERFVTRMVDISIIDAFKAELKQLLEQKYNIPVVTILKDYDPQTEYSGTVVILDKDIKDFIIGS